MIFLRVFSSFDSTFARMKLSKTDQNILQIALPAIVTNITVPLLGLVDTAIVGHMGSASFIGAIAVGSMIFNLIYWVFGFLRMGMSGMTAQARGRRQVEDIVRLLGRSVAVSLSIASLLLVFQWPLRELMLMLIHPGEGVRQLAETYFNIVVWGAPAVLSLYGLTGWFIGMQNTRIPMLVSVVQNVVNICASLLFVYVLDMQIEGVALGTVVAQYAGLLVAVLSLAPSFFLYRGRRSWRRLGRGFRWQSLRSKWGCYFRVNRDIFLRTLFLVGVNLFFTSAGARQGEVVLAVNALLMQLFLLLSYFLDGFAYAGEALGGRYWGASDANAFHDVVRRLFRWGVALALLFSVIYIVGGEPFLHLLTDNVSVVKASRSYVGWAYLLPLAGVAAFVWDGIFIGITATRAMLISSVVAAMVFFFTALLLMPLWGNHGLWCAMTLYLLTRGLVQTLLFRNIRLK